MPVERLDIASLSRAYAHDVLYPRDVVAAIDARIVERDDDHVWISRVPRLALCARAESLARERAAGAALPLYGIPFAVKDNIDVAGMPTTAACPEFAYVPNASAPVVESLIKAGAILIGKTNLDQFATGLVGTRSPYGACPNPFDARYISGGSSSGSAVAVATGLASFALGTDTAGSGRVPAAFNNIIGLKPTRGLVSTAGMVPACRSLDCISIFALTAVDARSILDTITAFDADDPYSQRTGADDYSLWNGEAPFRFGVPSAEQLQFFNDGAAAALYTQALARLKALGGEQVEINFAPFHDAAALLYDGPWIAERLTELQGFVSTHASAIHPVVRQVLMDGERYSAVDTFLAQHRLAQLRRATEREWTKMDVLVLPTAGTIYTVADVEAEPYKRNSDLGYYTNFTNLLDLCALALPAGFRPNGLPFGITLMAPAFHDASLCIVGQRYQRRLGGSLGATAHALPLEEPISGGAPVNATVSLAVVGAHLSGQPLNHQLVERSARLLKTCRTTGGYRLYALRGTVPPKPGLVFHPGEPGNGIEVELWEIPVRHFGSFVAAVPPPLSIGTLTLEDGKQVKGFVCETYAVTDALDITHHGSWRRYLASQSLHSHSTRSPRRRTT